LREINHYEMIGVKKKQGEKMKPPKVYLTLKQFAIEHSRRGWPTWDALRNIHFRRKTNGFETAFIKVGAKVLVDLDEFWYCVERLNEKGK